MSQKFDTEYGEPAPVPNDGPSMHDLAISHILAALSRGMQGEDQVPDNEVTPILAVVDELTARKEMGLKKYGTVLQAKNGRSAVRDALDESLDLIVYICQIIQEGNFPKDVNMDSMYRNACEFAIGLKYLQMCQNKDDKDDNSNTSGRITEAGSSDLAGRQHLPVSEVSGQEAN